MCFNAIRRKFTENEYGAQSTPYLTRIYMHMETNAFVFLNLLVD